MQAGTVCISPKSKGVSLHQAARQQQLSMTLSEQALQHLLWHLAQKAINMSKVHIRKPYT